MEAANLCPHMAGLFWNVFLPQKFQCGDACIEPRNAHFQRRVCICHYGLQRHVHGRAVPERLFERPPRAKADCGYWPATFGHRKPYNGLDGNRRLIGLIAGTEALGLKTYLNKKDQGYIITSFLFPEHPNFDFTIFYEKLHQRGQVIYQGKLSDTNCFRIGNIGQLYLDDIDRLIEAIAQVLEEMSVL